MSTRVAVTGLGVVCGLGFHWREVWRRMLAGESAVRPWQPEGVADFPVRYAAPVDRLQFERCFGHWPPLQAALDRRSRFGLVAAQQALADAGLADGVADGTAGARVAVVIGSGTPEPDARGMLLALGADGPRWARLFERRAQLDPGLRHGNDHLAVAIARQHRCSGPVLNLNTACAGAAQAIGLGLQLIRRGEAEVVIAGGADSVLNFHTMLALHLLGAPSVDERHGAHLCRPFDRERSGLVAGEGAGMVVLESMERALRRGVTLHGEVSGQGSSMDAHRPTAPHPEGLGAALAMQRALHDAGWAPEQVQHINAHGTSTLLNDVAEARAIRRVFAAGEHHRRLAVSANKSQLGHLITAAGGPECIATLLALKTGWLPPTLNLDHPDPACGLDVVAQRARPTQATKALCNSFGFGGLNVSLAISRAEAPPGERQAW